MRARRVSALWAGGGCRPVRGHALRLVVTADLEQITFEMPWRARHTA